MASGPTAWIPVVRNALWLLGWLGGSAGARGVLGAAPSRAQVPLAGAGAHPGFLSPGHPPLPLSPRFTPHRPVHLGAFPPPFEPPPTLRAVRAVPGAPRAPSLAPAPSLALGD